MCAVLDILYCIVQYSVYFLYFDFLLKSVFLHREAAMDLVYGLFDRYVLADFNF